VKFYNSGVVTRDRRIGPRYVDSFMNGYALRFEAVLFPYVNFYRYEPSKNSQYLGTKLLARV
jgi:hypothetical protein